MGLDIGSVLGGGLAGMTLLALWWWWERRCRRPLVSTVMLTRRPILMTNIATVAVGMGLYFGFLRADHLRSGTDRQRIRLWGHGSAGQRGVPAARGAGRLSRRPDQRALHRPIRCPPVLAVGAAIGVSGFTMLTLAHSTRWQVICAGVLINAYISLAYGRCPPW